MMGHAQCKFGRLCYVLVSDEWLTIRIPSVVGKLKKAGDNEKKAFSFGDDVIKHPNRHVMTWPINGGTDFFACYNNVIIILCINLCSRSSHTVHSGLITDWDNAERLWSHIFTNFLSLSLWYERWHKFCSRLSNVSFPY